MLNPIRNVERSPGPGGPDMGGLDIAPKRSSFSGLRRRPHNYPANRSKGVAVLKVPKFQEGGDYQEEEAPDPADLREPADSLSPHDAQLKEIVVDAMAALRGESPDAEAAIQRFIDAFGEADYRELRRMVLGAAGPPAPDEEEDNPEEPGPEPAPEPDEGEDDATGMQVGGLLRGPGSGQSDEIEAATPSGRKVLLSDGEYVIDAPTVAALGDGSTTAGARRLDAFRKAVREQSYGHNDQAKPMKKGGRALLAALGQ
jgi:hypothetical protein